MGLQRFKKKKQPNNKRGIILAIVLLLTLFLWLNMDSIINNLFP